MIDWSGSEGAGAGGGVPKPRPVGTSVRGISRLVADDGRDPACTCDEDGRTRLAEPGLCGRDETGDWFRLPVGGYGP